MPMTRGLKLGRVFATRQNELVGMDLFCGLPESNTGYRNILVMTDYVTKYVVAVPLFSKTAEEVAQEFVDKWCLVYGWPERIQTDEGGGFTGKVLKGITEAARVKRSTTTPYHPQANGQVERTNKTIAQMLSKRCYAQRTWSKILILIWHMPRTNMEKGLHKKLMLPGKGPYKVTKVFKESNTVKVELAQNLQLTVNLKNVKRYFSRPEWMKDDHEEFTEEEPQTPSETVDHTDEEITVTYKRPVPVEEITEIFRGPTCENIVSPANVEEPESFAIGVTVEALRSGEWISGVITKIRKTKKAVTAKIIGPRINAWHKMHSTSVRRPA
jgi:hypothetical protein